MNIVSTTTVDEKIEADDQLRQTISQTYLLKLIVDNANPGKREIVIEDEQFKYEFVNVTESPGTILLFDVISLND